MDNIINDGSGSNGNVNAMAANQTSLFLCNNKIQEKSMGVWVDAPTLPA